MLFGGVDGSTVRADEWRWDGTRWTQHTPARAKELAGLVVAKTAERDQAAAKLAKAEQLAAEKAAAEAAAKVPELTEAEKKALRDARYAARKARKK